MVPKSPYRPGILTHATGQRYPALRLIYKEKAEKCHQGSCLINWVVRFQCYPLAQRLERLKILDCPGKVYTVNLTTHKKVDSVFVPWKGNLSWPSSDSRDLVGLYSNSNWYPCLMPGREENLALRLARLLFPLRLEDLKKLFPGVLVCSL